MTTLDAPGRFTMMYTCHRCRTVDREVIVEARQENEEVKAWVERVVLPGIHRDHHAWAPFCRSENVDLKMPLPNDANFIGEAPKQ